MVIKRGEIWWASLPTPVGSEPGFRRPVVIVQSDGFNRSLIHTCIAAAITLNLRLAEAPGNFLLKKRSSRLKKDSVVNVSQIITIDKKFLTERLSTLSNDQIQLLDEGLRIVLDL